VFVDTLRVANPSHRWSTGGSGGGCWQGVELGGIGRWLSVTLITEHGRVSRTLSSIAMARHALPIYLRTVGWSPLGEWPAAIFYPLGHPMPSPCRAPMLRNVGHPLDAETHLEVVGYQILHDQGER
jgi:hypothetical protein